MDKLKPSVAEEFSKQLAVAFDLGLHDSNAVWMSSRATKLMERAVDRAGSVHLDEDDQTACYPGTTVVRAKVAVPKWDRVAPDYSPVEFTDGTVADSDADILQSAAVLMFNEVDTFNNVDRRSYLGTYKIVNGAPRNPEERTGIIGRGCLQRWGPNHMADPVITRWQRDETGEICKKEGCPVLEVLVAETADAAASSAAAAAAAATFHLPSGPVECFGRLPVSLTGMFADSMAGSSNGEVLHRRARAGTNLTFGERVGIFNDKVQAPVASTPNAATPATTTAVAGAKKGGVPHTVDEIFSSGGNVIFQGYSTDARNTDHAWIETSVVHYHDPGTVFAEVEAIDNLKWIPIDEDLDLDVRHREVVVQVVEEHGAHFADKLSPILATMMASIEKKGIKHEGLYRLSGSSVNVKALKAAALAGEVHTFDHVLDVHELTGTVKMILREMNPPLLTFSLYDRILLAARSKNSSKWVGLLAALPRTNWKILSSIIQHLKRVCGHEQLNRMSVENLSIVFGPTMIRSPGGLSSDLRDHKLQCQAAKIMISLPSTTLDEVEIARTQKGWKPAVVSRFSSYGVEGKSRKSSGSARTSTIPASLIARVEEEAKWEEEAAANEAGMKARSEGEADAEVNVGAAVEVAVVPTAGEGGDSTRSMAARPTPAPRPAKISAFAKRATITNYGETSVDEDDEDDESVTSGSYDVTPAPQPAKISAFAKCATITNYGETSVDEDDEDDESVTSGSYDVTVDAVPEPAQEPAQIAPETAPATAPALDVTAEPAVAAPLPMCAPLPDPLPEVVAPAYPKTVVLTKEDGVRLGFNIGRRAEGDGEGILISDVTAGSPSDGVLAIGDIVMCINARSVSNGKLKPAKVEIRDSATTVTFTIVGNVDAETTSENVEETNAEVVPLAIVQVEKKNSTPAFVDDDGAPASTRVIEPTVALSTLSKLRQRIDRGREHNESKASVEKEPTPELPPVTTPAAAPAKEQEPAQIAPETAPATAPALDVTAEPAVAAPLPMCAPLPDPLPEVVAPAYPKTVVLTKEDGVRLGFNIGRRAEGDGEGILISDVTAGSPSDGVLAIGDIVMCINARSVSNGKLKPAKVEIRDSATTVTFTIVGNVDAETTSENVEEAAPVSASFPDDDQEYMEVEVASEDTPAQIEAPVAAPRPAPFVKALSTNEMLANQIIGSFDFGSLEGLSLLDLDGTSSSADGESEYGDGACNLNLDAPGNCTSPEGFDEEAEPGAMEQDSAIGSSNSATSSSSSKASAHSHADTTGDCMNCESFGVEGSYSEEDAQFFCSSCWSYYDGEDDESEGAESDDIDVKVSTPKAFELLQPALQEDSAAASEAPPPANRQSRVIRLSILNEEGEEAGLLDDETAVDDEVVFDADGLPVCRGDRSSFAPWEVQDEEEEEVVANPAATAAAAAHNSRVNQLSTKELMMIASPKGTRKAAAKKLGPLAASLDQRREGSCFMGTNSTWKRRYLVLQGTILKVYKQQKKQSKADYVLLSPKTRAKRTAKRELALLTESNGTQVTSRFRFSSKMECTEWVRVIQNILGNLHSVC